MAIEVFLIDWDEYRGDTFKYDLACSRAGVPINMTGGDLWFTARYPDDSVAIDRSTRNGGIVWLNQAGGLARLTVRPADTELIPMDSDSLTLNCDVQMQEQNADVETIGDGTLKLWKEETRTRRELE